MSIEVRDTQERISVFKHPVISIKVPSAWTNESADYDTKISSAGDNEWLRGWHCARRVAKRAFAAYYGLEGQFQQKHDSWESGRPDYDFSVSSDSRSCLITLHTIPIKDNKPKIGRTFTTNVYRSNKSLELPLVHVFSIWWCPIVMLIGWISNNDLKERGKTEINEQKLKPIYTHEVLKEIDKRGMYT